MMEFITKCGIFTIQGFTKKDFSATQVEQEQPSPACHSRTD
jgi:hypothetical protein